MEDSKPIGIIQIPNSNNFRIESQSLHGTRDTLEPGKGIFNRQENELVLVDSKGNEIGYQKVVTRQKTKQQTVQNFDSEIILPKHSKNRTNPLKFYN